MLLNNEQTTPSDQPQTPESILANSTAVFSPNIDKTMTRDELLSLIRMASTAGIDPRGILGSAKYILSICPWDLVTEAFHHGAGLRRYAIQAVPRGEYLVLPIYSTFTRILDTTLSEDEIMSQGHQKVERPIAAQQVVDTLLQYWAGDHAGNRSGNTIGIMQIAGPKPTDEELKRIRKTQDGFFRGLVSIADALHINGKGDKINLDHRRSLDNLPDEPRDRHPWYIQMGTSDDHIPNGCPRCAAKVPKTAFVCPTCREDLAQFMLDRGITPDAKSMPGIAREHGYLLAQQKKSKPAAPAPTQSTPAPETKGNK